MYQCIDEPGAIRHFSLGMKLFDSASDPIRDLYKRAKRELRLKKRREWKEKNLPDKPLDK